MRNRNMRQMVFTHSLVYTFESNNRKYFLYIEKTIPGLLILVVVKVCR